MTIVNDDVVRRTLARILEGLDDVRPVTPYTIAEVVRRASVEPAIAPMLAALDALDAKHAGWHVGDHARRYMHTSTGGMLRATDSCGRRLHGTLWNGRGAARYFTIVVFTIEQIQAMRIGGRKYERHVQIRNDGLEQLEHLMIDRRASCVADVWEDWQPERGDDPGVAV